MIYVRNSLGHKVSERRACRVLGQIRSTQRRQTHVPDEEPRLRGVLPNQLYVMDQTMDVYEVERSLAQHLVSDVYVTAAGVAGLRKLHSGSLLLRAFHCYIACSLNESSVLTSEPT